MRNSEMTINIQVIVMLMVVGHFWTPAISLHSRGVTESNLIQQETKRTPSKLMNDFAPIPDELNNIDKRRKGNN
jgi:hypothetical protein